ncbi:MAG: hypothetical protein KJ614_08875 [Gammaproteobacteria bacterium]|uniref:hypothetical protein n=1 Tax=Rhodoferax sp. TaxID=50421 RepID=UPI0017E5C271|nr:hypothetical protein [Rhodoferax sp.]MBU3899024.1 hypothetical protein [Gammaproteobacteria bacterium]MBA3057676.1 hypothetical protein [Rhodoferax sp.]MBU3998242.1 hypothetical protein [Gammaproteobacteria bacterium]MBU4018467.1 hypothetical protein [Gammaproteobacteria bacterium]MBU4080479.1 hypothetical protein [Gammaproteobacteria bacterium]
MAIGALHCALKKIKKIGLEQSLIRRNTHAGQGVNQKLFALKLHRFYAWFGRFSPCASAFFGI